MKKNTDKKICFVVPTLRKGGLERVVSLLSNNICKYSSVSIITLTDDLVEYSFDGSIEIYHLTQEQKFNRFYLIRKLIYQLKIVQPDIVIGFSEVFNPITIVAAKCCNIKVFVSDRSSPLIPYSIRDRVLKKVTYWLAAGIIAQTELAKSVLLKKGLNRNVFILPNPVSNFKNIEFNFKAKKIVTVGRLISSKNQLELIRIFHEINKKDWQLILAGEGNSRKELEHFISINELNGSVRLIGKIDDIECVLSQASIFAFTSLSEGFPNAVMEGLCFPLATIAYDCPAGVSDLIDNCRNGYLIPLGDRDLFRNELMKLMESDEERLRLMKESIKSRTKYSQTQISKLLYSYITR